MLPRTIGLQVTAAWSACRDMTTLWQLAVSALAHRNTTSLVLRTVLHIIFILKTRFYDAGSLTFVIRQLLRTRAICRSRSGLGKGHYGLRACSNFIVPEADAPVALPSEFVPPKT